MVLGKCRLLRFAFFAIMGWATSGVAADELAQCQSALAQIPDGAAICADPDVATLWHQLLIRASSHSPDLLGRTDQTMAGIAVESPDVYLRTYAGACASSPPQRLSSDPNTASRMCLLDWLHSGTLDDYPVIAGDVPDKYLNTPAWIYHDFHATRFPFEPHLIRSGNRALCTALEKAIQTDFRLVHHQFRDGRFGRRPEADIGEDATRFVIPGGQWIPDPDGVTTGESAGQNRDEGQPSVALEYRGQRYRYRNEAIAGGGVAGHLVALTAAGDQADLCTVSVLPQVISGAVTATAERLPVPNDLRLLTETVSLLQGGRPDVLPVVSFSQRGSLVAQALVRPWEVMLTPPAGYEADPYFPSALVTRYDLWKAGLDDLSLFHTDRTLEVARLPAIRALAAFYVSAYGIPGSEANDAAAVAVDEIIAGSFRFDIESAPYSVPLDAFTAARVHREVAEFVSYSPTLRDIAYWRPGGPSAQIHGAQPLTSLLHAALLEGSPTQALEVMLDSGATLRGEPLGVQRGAPDVEPALFDALEHPAEIEFLIAKGADVNEPNARGKTALMYAAQYDLVETAALLLSHHADGHAKGPQDRSALDYAAENASPALIKALLDSGARDSEATEEHFSVYLQSNLNLTPEQRHLKLADVAALSEDKGPSFPCRNARGVERAICSNAELAAKDARLAALYRSAAAVRHGDVVADQRDWLRMRDALCTATNDDDTVACLLGQYRARIKVLQYSRNAPAGP